MLNEKVLFITLEFACMLCVALLLIMFVTGEVKPDAITAFMTFFFSCMAIVYQSIQQSISWKNEQKEKV